MSDTYCGKSCAECEHSEQLCCAGCKQGPGKAISGNCEIARCCRLKGRESCSECMFRSSCEKFGERYRAPQQRSQKQEAAKTQHKKSGNDAVVLGRWLRILFWFILPSTLAASLSLTESTQFIGECITVALSLAYSLILIRLHPLQSHYCTAGLSRLLVALGTALPLLLPLEDSVLQLINLPVAVCSLTAAYFELCAHAAALERIDFSLSEKWAALKKWFIGVFVLTFVTSIVTLMPITVLLPLVNPAIALVRITSLVLGILQLVYLYQSAKACRTFQ